MQQSRTDPVAWPLVTTSLKVMWERSSTNGGFEWANKTGPRRGRGEGRQANPEHDLAQEIRSASQYLDTVFRFSQESPAISPKPSLANKERKATVSRVSSQTLELQYVEELKRALYIAEFVDLLNCVEVIIPLMFCTSRDFLVAKLHDGDPGDDGRTVIDLTASP
ncbi:hypothetical protein ON010_g8685 [Phytophthora cinnamomi]|nr:hypothetical protein ON010_g8685 [Phytophthora cinnamomi]